MSSERIEEKAAKLRKPERKETDKGHDGGDVGQAPALAGLQHLVGNRAVQRLIAQRRAEGPTELDDETAERISQARGSGQSLDSRVQEQMSEAMGHDFSSVRVHTSPEADDLNRQLGAKAFTTGRDVFFREGAYDPHSSSGKELIAHELTHVAQQSTGAVQSVGRMTVNAPGDAFEQEADAVAKQVAAPGMTSEEGIQRQETPEEEELQTQPAEEEEEELLQPQPMEEEEEEETAQMKAIQHQEELPEEEL